MKDLDFDELDRAVNSLMTSVSKTEPPKDEDPVKTLTITPTLSPGEVPKIDAPVVTPLPTPDAPMISSAPDVPVVLPRRERSAEPSLAARRGGRFMDVVHPSSDMKPRPTAASAISRQGATIAPAPRPETTALPETGLPVPDKPIPDVPTPQPSIEHSVAVSEWPDPLDMIDFDASEEKATSSLLDMPDESPIADTHEQPSKKSEPDTPLFTPFLSGAKVEKRPLGGAAPISVEEPDHTPVPNASTTGSVNDSNDQLPALPKDVEPILPAELQRELMAIESDANVASHGDSEPEPVKKTGTPVDSHRPVKEGSMPDAPVVSSGPTSIPQQYREEPSTGDTASGAIYDTDTYHQPLSHPVKKKSGWLWIVWIILIILVGAAIGAGLFFFGVV